MRNLCALICVSMLAQSALAAQAESEGGGKIGSGQDRIVSAPQGEAERATAAGVESLTPDQLATEISDVYEEVLRTLAEIGVQKKRGLHVIDSVDASRFKELIAAYEGQAHLGIPYFPESTKLKERMVRILDTRVHRSDVEGRFLVPVGRLKALLDEFRKRPQNSFSGAELGRISGVLSEASNTLIVHQELRATEEINFGYLDIPVESTSLLSAVRGHLPHGAITYKPAQPVRRYGFYKTHNTPELRNVRFWCINPGSGFTTTVILGGKDVPLPDDNQSSGGAADFEAKYFNTDVKWFNLYQ